MFCPRLDHFVRLNPNGTVSRCGHMIGAPEFSNLDSMESSRWLEDIKRCFAQDVWPRECVRCQQTEMINQTSIRLNAIKFHSLQSRSDYLTAGGVLDNICNSACLTCNEHLSTKIGSLKSKTYPIVNNSQRFWQLPTERLVHLDINGGEPSASPNYKNLLQNLPVNVSSIRINTNAALIMTELEQLRHRGIHVTVTVSLDGIGQVHDRVRWPIKWDKFYSNLMRYRDMDIDLNTWTTVSALNISDLPNIFDFVAQHALEHSWALLTQPDVLNVRYQNHMTRDFADVLPGHVAIDTDNQTALEAYLQHQYDLRHMR